jgi:hypothetical protein
MITKRHIITNEEFNDFTKIMNKIYNIDKNVLIKHSDICYFYNEQIVNYKTDESIIMIKKIISIPEYLISPQELKIFKNFPEIKETLCQYFTNMENVKYICCINTQSNSEIMELRKYYDFSQMSIKNFNILLSYLPLIIVHEYFNKNIDKITNENTDIKLLDAILMFDDINNFESFNNLRSKFNIEYSNSDLIYLIDNLSNNRELFLHVFENILQRKVIPTEQTFKYLTDTQTKCVYKCHYVNEIVQLLINYGYDISQSELLDLTKKCIFINNCNIEINNEIFIGYISKLRRGKYPDFIKNYRPSDEEFYNFFREPVKIVVLNNYLKITKRVLDVKCLEIAFRHCYVGGVPYGIREKFISGLLSKVRPNLQCILYCVNDLVVRTFIKDNYLDLKNNNNTDSSLVIKKLKIICMTHSIYCCSWIISLIMMST